MFSELLEWLFGSENSDRKKSKKVFISFAIEDIRYRDLLVGQAKSKHTPFKLIDMSVKKAWPENIWKKRCREKIRGCDCVIVLLSKNTWHSSGLRWEIKCAREERIRIMGMHIKKNDKRAIPPELKGIQIIEWSWKNLEKFLK